MPPKHARLLASDSLIQESGLMSELFLDSDPGTGSCNATYVRESPREYDRRTDTGDVVTLPRTRFFIRLTYALVAGLLSTGELLASSRQEGATLSIKAVLVDADLNLRPVPKHVLTMTPAPGTTSTPIRVVLGLDGTISLKVMPGDYVLKSEKPLSFQGKSYHWDQRVSLPNGSQLLLELSVDNATIVLDPVAARAGSGLPQLFRDWQDSVVTVWSERGHGSGFLIDRGGLILTNQHVIGSSEYVAVQLSPALKVVARVLSANPQKDIAVLWIHPSTVAAIKPVDLAFSNGVESPVVEGEQVFTIGSPLNQRKVMTSGIVSRVEPRVIISDVNINHGNSGGPLFTADGRVIGVTTFGDFTSAGGPGISGVVRIDEAREEIQLAKAAMKPAAAPNATALPVEPLRPFPVDALRATVESREVRLKDYEVPTKNFELTFVTPVLLYGLQYEEQRENLKERAKRNRSAGAIQETIPVFESFRNWATYAGEFKPVLMIRATPKLVEGVWSGLSRGLAASQGLYAGPAKLRFKNDFYKMRVLCGGSEVEPIHPSRIEHRVAVHNAAVSVNDATYEGLYVYGPDAIGPHCGKVVIELFTERDPEKADRVVLKPGSAEWVWKDFSSFRAVGGETRVR